jgi:hypothetical protein
MTEASRHFVLLRSYFFLSDRRVPPGECGFTSSDRDPGTNGVITKLAAERGIKAKSAILQAVISWTRPAGGSLQPVERSAFRNPRILDLPFDNLIGQFIH